MSLECLAPERLATLAERAAEAEVARLEERLRQAVDTALRLWPAYLDYPEVGKPSVEFDVFAAAMRELELVREMEKRDAR